MQTIKQPFGSESGNLISVGTAATGCSAAEFGDGHLHRTVLTFADLAIITPTAAANKAGGVKIYSFPAGVVVTRAQYINASLNAINDVCAADTPVIGIGTTIGSGAVAVLSGTAGFVNMTAGAAVADCNATEKLNTVNTQLVVNAADSHDVFLNVAGSWTGADSITATGTVVIEWSFIY